MHKSIIVSGYTVLTIFLLLSESQAVFPVLVSFLIELVLLTLVYNVALFRSLKAKAFISGSVTGAVFGLVTFSMIFVVFTSASYDGVYAGEGELLIELIKQNKSSLIGVSMMLAIAYAADIGRYIGGPEGVEYSRQRLIGQGFKIWAVTVACILLSFLLGKKEVFLITIAVLRLAMEFINERLWFSKEQRRTGF